MNRRRVNMTGAFLFRDLDVNGKMVKEQQDAEKALFRYIRRGLSNHVLKSEGQFFHILKELRSRCNEINSHRIGRGKYLHIDGALPTDHTIGWIKITFLDVRKAQACITLVNCEGEIGDSNEDDEEGRLS